MGFIKNLFKFATTADPNQAGRHAKRGKHAAKKPSKKICDFQWTAFGEVPGHNQHWCYDDPGHGGPHKCGSIGCGITTPLCHQDRAGHIVACQKTRST